MDGHLQFLAGRKVHGIVVLSVFVSHHNDFVDLGNLFKLFLDAELTEERGYVLSKGQSRSY